MSSPVRKILIVAIALIVVDIAYARVQTPKGSTSKPAVTNRPQEVGENVVIEGLSNGPVYYIDGRLTGPGGSITRERVAIPRSAIDVLTVYKLEAVMRCEKGRGCFDWPCQPPHDDTCPGPPPPPPPPWPVRTGNELRGFVAASPALKK
jgi:hypothetical protein